MTEKQFAVIAASIRTCYPNTHVLETDEAKDIWFAMLRDLDYQQVSYNLQRFIQTERRIPTVADLREPLRPAGNDLGEAEAWSMVYKAICKSSYGAEEEFAKLPVTVQKAVGSPANLRSMATDNDFNFGVESSNFKRAYRTILEREKSEAKMSEPLKAAIEMIAARGSRAITEKGEDTNG